MKKILLIIVLLVAIPSCSTEDDFTPETTSEPQTTSVGISTGEEFYATTTGKNVQRGSMFASISEMQIIATHESGYASTTDFTLVANGTPGAGTKFIMDNVHIGNNTFTASSKTNVTEKLETAQFARPTGATSSTNSNIVSQFSTLNTRNPYAIYTNVNPVNLTIAQGNAQNVKIPMKTNNSRIIAVFSTDDITNFFTRYNVVTITCYVNGVAFGPSATCNASTNATFYWSDKNSIAGKSILFKFINTPLLGGQDTYNSPSIVIKASNTLKMLYTIKDKTLISTPM